MGVGPEVRARVKVEVEVEVDMGATDRVETPRGVSPPWWDSPPTGVGTLSGAEAGVGVGGSLHPPVAGVRCLGSVTQRGRRPLLLRPPPGPLAPSARVSPGALRLPRPTPRPGPQRRAPSGRAQGRRLLGRCDMRHHLLHGGNATFLKHAADPDSLVL